MFKAICPLCQHHSFLHAHIRVKNRLYHYCTNCSLIQIEENNRPDPASEKARYLLHNNCAGNNSYHNYMTGIMNELIIPFVKPESRILDFGSGPYPLLTQLCNETGFSTAFFDKFFDSTPSALEKTYNVITCIEVLEHIYNPKETFRMLIDLLLPEGLLIIKTMFHQDNEQLFSRWWYTEDPTHITFFSEKTFLFIAEKFSLSIIKNDKKSAIIFRKSA